VGFRSIMWQILDFRAKQWIKHIVKCCHWARTTNIGLLRPKVRNNIGAWGTFPLIFPNQNVGGSAPSIPGGVDSSGHQFVRLSCLQDLCVPLTTVSTRAALRSAAPGDVVVPRTRRRLGNRAFCVVRHSNCFFCDNFQESTHLFIQSYYTT